VYTDASAVYIYIKPYNKLNQDTSNNLNDPSGNANSNIYADIYSENIDLSFNARTGKYRYYYYQKTVDELDVSTNDVSLNAVSRATGKIAPWMNISGGGPEFLGPSGTLIPEYVINDDLIFPDIDTINHIINTDGSLNITVTLSSFQSRVNELMNKIIFSWSHYETDCSCCCFEPIYEYTQSALDYSGAKQYFIYPENLITETSGNTVTRKYDAVFMLPLAGFTNLAATIKNITETTTISTINADYRTFSINGGDSSDNLDVVLTLHKKSVTGLRGNVQYSENDFSNTAVVSVADIDIDPFYGTARSHQYFNDGSGTQSQLSITMTPAKYSLANLYLPYYYTDLILDVSNSTYTAKINVYGSSDYSSFDEDLYSPNFILNDTTPIGMPNIKTRDLCYNLVPENNSTRVTITDPSHSNYTVAVISINSDNRGLLVPATIFYSPCNVFYTVSNNNNNTNYVSSTNSSGKLNVDDGIILDYSWQNLLVNSRALFTLNPDSIAYNIVGQSLQAPSPIDKLQLTYTNAETVNLKYYRGYNSKTYSNNITINRSSVIPTFTFGNNYYATDFIYIYNGWNNPLNINGGIGSIGNILTFHYSRLPFFYITGNTFERDVVVNSDKYIVTETNCHTRSGHLKDNSGVLWQDPSNNFKILSGAIIDHSNHSNWSVTYGGLLLDVYYNNEYYGNPVDMSWNNIIGPPTDISNLNTVYFNYNNVSISGGSLPFEIDFSDNTPKNCTSYWQIVPPQFEFVQASINAVNTLPFHTGDISYGEITYKLASVDIDTNTYYPFSDLSGYNNVKFTYNNNENINYSDFASSTDETIYNYYIDGTYITITQITTNNQTREVYNGLIRDISTAGNIVVTPPYSSGGPYHIAYKQISNSNTPLLFNISNPFLSSIVNETEKHYINLIPTTTARISLVGITPYMDDNKNYNLRLDKYTTDSISFNGGSSFSLFDFDLSYSFIDVSLNIPASISATPYNLNTIRLNTILTPEQIVWEPSGKIYANTVNFNLNALDNSGTELLSQIFSFSEPNVYNYTYITAPDIFTVAAGDGANVFRIDFNGRVSAPLLSGVQVNLNVSNITKNNSPTPSQELTSYKVDTHTTAM
jgi:hypothetical protein